MITVAIHVECRLQRSDLGCPVNQDRFDAVVCTDQVAEHPTSLGLVFGVTLAAIRWLFWESKFTKPILWTPSQFSWGIMRSRRCGLVGQFVRAP